MKVLFVETKLEGHRTVYLNALCSGVCECAVLLPQRCEKLPCRQYVYEKNKYCSERSFGNYIAWLREIRNTAERERCDVVHFLCGDELYRYFGAGLGMFRQKVFVTFHHMLFSVLKKVTYKCIFSKITAGIVHTQSIKERLNDIGIKNVFKVEYPCFNSAFLPDAVISKNSLGIPADRTCLMVLGGIVRYKGLDILLEALNSVSAPFTLCIAGYPYEFSEDFINEKIAGYRENVVLYLHRLNDLEYEQASVAGDIIMLPYRKEFDGASGPMIDAAWHRRPVIAADHGSMGDVVKRHSLGLTFSSEDPVSLAKNITQALEKGLSWNENAEKFREMLNPKYFTEKYNALYKNSLCDSEE